jgi:DNA modification methylase
MGTVPNLGSYQVRAVSALKPYEKNARTHSAEQVEQIARSMKEFGFTNPLLIDEQDRIIAGHGRLQAARALKMSDVPVIVLSGLTDSQRRALILADNKIALNSGWDLNLLSDELADLKLDGYDLTLTGFSLEEIDNLTPVVVDEIDPDDAPDLPAEPKTKPGDVWVMGAHRLVCGDSTSMDTMDKLLRGEFVDIVWTDPPYNVAYGGDGSNAANKNKVDGGNRNTREILNDDMSDSDFRDFMSSVYATMFAVCKPGAAVYVAHSETERATFTRAFLDNGFKLSGCLIWRKDSLVLGRSDYQWQHEPILYGWKPGSRHRWYGGRKLTTMIDLDQDRMPFKRRDDGKYEIRLGDTVFVIDGTATIEELVPSVINEPKPKRNDVHPTMKPVALIERMLRNSARPGDIVLDLFGGSGSTLMAAERLGMCARLSELDPRYCDVIVERWENYTGRKAVLEAQGDG